MLNEAPSSNDAKHVASNVHLTTMGAQKFVSCKIASQILKKINFTIKTLKWHSYMIRDIIMFILDSMLVSQHN